MRCTRQGHLGANEHVHKLLGILPIDTSLFVKVLALSPAPSPALPPARRM